MANLSRLRRPVAEAWDWQLRGRCGSADASVFFISELPTRAGRRHREAQAKAICVGCPVRPQCAAYALGTRQPHGVWGGFSEGERRRLLALGWEDLADRRRRRVDIAGLVARLVGSEGSSELSSTARGPSRSVLEHEGHQ